MTKSPDEYESAQCGGPYCRPWRPALSRKYASAAASAAGSAGGLRWLCKRPVLAGVPTYWHLYPRPAARKREIAVQTEARHHCTLLVRGPIRPICPVFEAKAFSRDASARQSRRFPQLSPPPLKHNRLGRFAFPGDLLYISAFCRAHTARHGAYTVFEGKAGYLCRTRRGGKFFRAKTGCQSCPVQRAPPNTDRSLLRGRAALAAIKHSAASYRPRGRPP